MSLFIKWIDDKTRIDPVLKAAIAHLWFVTIHPFEDGNGRIARAIGDMALARQLIDVAATAGADPAGTSRPWPLHADRRAVGIEFDELCLRIADLSLGLRGPRQG